MSTPSSAVVLPTARASSLQCLVPLRVDVSVAGNSSKVSPTTPSLRIVETLYMDPNVWPLRRTPTTRDDDDDWIAANARYLAIQLLTDLEVQGMGRTVRHFTNRTDLWSVALAQQVMEQLRPQLAVVAAQQQRTTRRRRHGPFVSLPQPPTKRRKIVTQEEVKREEEALATAAAAKEETAGNEGSDSRHTTPSAASPGATAATTDNNSESCSSLIPIRIRLSIHGMRIHDDCLWDPSLVGVTPLAYARILGRDLSLPAEAVQAIAVDMSEQIAGSPRSAAEDTTEEDNPVRENTRTTAAWSLNSRTHISHVAHLVAQHRQP
jgi:hypothetical protein